MNHSDTLFSIAEELLQKAEREMERSEEDVVTHFICSHARQSLSNFLAGFLIRQNIEIEHPVTLTSLLDQCKLADVRFESLDLSQLGCRNKTNDYDYCLDVEKVRECIKVALQAQAIVMSDKQEATGIVYSEYRSMKSE